MEIKSEEGVAKNRESGVSVVIPVYNASRYLGGAFECLRAQTLRRAEFIFVEDASTDSSRHMILKFLKDEPRARAVFRERNGRQGSARNDGLAASRLEYFAFFDADDYVPPNYFECLLKCAEMNCADLAICPIKKERRGRLRKMLFFEGSAATENLGEIFRLSQVPKYGFCFNKIARLDKLGAVKFRENVWYEDIDYTVRLLAKTRRAAFTDEVFYTYKINPHSCTKSREMAEEKERDLRLALRLTAQIIGEKNLPADANLLARFERTKLFGITLLKAAYHYGGLKKYYFLDFLPVWSRSMNVDALY